MAPFWLDGSFYGIRAIYAAAVALTQRNGLSFGHGLTAVDNPGQARTDVAINDAELSSGTCVDIDNGDSTYDIPAGVTTVRVNSGSGSVVARLGPVASNKDVSVQIIAWAGSAAAQNITIDCTDSTINGVAAGAATVKINTDYGGAVCHCDGTKWRTTQATA